jgi:hypothetical protein
MRHTATWLKDVHIGVAFQMDWTAVINNCVNLIYCVSAVQIGFGEALEVLIPSFETETAKCCRFEGQVIVYTVGFL